MKRTITVLALALLLTGCGIDAPEGLSDVSSSDDATPEPTSAPAGSPTAPPSSPSTPTPSGSPAPPPSESPMSSNPTPSGTVLDATLTFEQYGGFVQPEKLQVQPDGRGALIAVVGGEERATFDLPDDALRALADQAASLSEEDPDQTSDLPEHVDATNWVITYGDTRVVATEPTMSDSLRPLVERLQGLLEEHRPTS